LESSAASLRISPLSLASALLASSAVIVAASTGIRWLSISLTILGLVAGVVGILAYRSGNNARSRISSGVGGILSASVLAIALFAPTVLNPFWVSEIAASDPNECMVVPRNKTRGPGKPLAANDWVESATDGIRQDDLFIQLQSVKSDRLPDKGSATFLLVNLRIDQMRDGRAIKFERFGKDRHVPKLVDDTGRDYAFLGDRIRKAPSKFDRLFMVDQLLVFELPTQFQFLNLTLPASTWGREGACRFRITEIVKEPPPDMAKKIADLKALLRSPAQTPPERALGRAKFAKNCQECHTLFGTGGKTGPDLTPSKRNDLDFLLTSIIDPSAVIEKKYQPTFVLTTSGQVYNGIIQKEDAQAITLLVPSKLIVVPRDEIEEMRASNISIMPTELLQDFTDHEKRSLIAYLTGSSQSPMLATPENVSHFFPPAQDLTNWHADGPRWTVDKGVLISPEPVGGKPPLLIGDLIIADDFTVTLRFNPGKEGRGAILIGDAGQSEFSKAVRIAFETEKPISVTTQGELSLPDEKTEKVKADWNKLEIAVAANGFSVKLNDKDAASATGITWPDRRVVVVEGASIPNREVRFRNLEMQLTVPKK
jgi:putative heme-binding domain-containing protein